jgi:hypothetical protein
MDQIEQRVQLPKGAGSLGEYSRYYADGDSGEVVAAYLMIPKDERRPGEACEELDRNVEGHTVPCEPIGLPWAIPAGQRRWLKDKRDLPFINDGGCADVNVTYDRAKSAVTSVECNGQL